MIHVAELTWMMMISCSGRPDQPPGSSLAVM